MFDKIEIERFRGIKHASIGGFKQINLFFGKNNCGKSSLLESLFLVSGLSNPLLPVNVNFMRGYGKVRLNDLKLNFYNLDSSCPIHIRMENEEKRDLKINLFEQNQDSVRNHTQLFVTTHDVDSIKGFRDAALGNYGDIVAAFKLLKTSDDELKAYHYSLESLDYSINQEIEVR